MTSAEFIVAITIVFADRVINQKRRIESAKLVCNLNLTLEILAN